MSSRAGGDLRVKCGPYRQTPGNYRPPPTYQEIRKKGRKIKSFWARAEGYSMGA